MGALYYGSDGLVRGGATGITGVTKNKDFKPNALVGDAMETQNVAGGMCSDGSSTKLLKAQQQTPQSARPMAVSLQGPPGPATQLATALATLLFRTRFGRSKLAIPLLPNTLFPTDTAMRMLALRTSPPLVQPRPSKVRRSFQLFKPARTCLPTLLPRQTLVGAPTRLVQPRLLPGTVVRPSSPRCAKTTDVLGAPTRDCTDAELK